MFAHIILDPYKKAKDIEQLLSESFENEEKSISPLPKKKKYNPVYID